MRHEACDLRTRALVRASTTTIYVGQQTGPPRRSVSPLVRGDYILDYYDYGAHIEIPLPRC